MNHPPSRTNLPRNCTFDPGDWRILARRWFPVAIAASCASHYLRHAMRADHIVHGRVVFFASKQGFAAGSGFRRSDIHFAIIHFSIPIFPAQR
jgi:hypothetical protein